MKWIAFWKIQFHSFSWPIIAIHYQTSVPNVCQFGMQQQQNDDFLHHYVTFIVQVSFAELCLRKSNSVILFYVIIWGKVFNFQLNIIYLNINRCCCFGYFHTTVITEWSHKLNTMFSCKACQRRLRLESVVTPTSYE